MSTWVWTLVRGPLARRVPWATLAAGGAACAVALWWRALVVDSPADLVTVVRLASVLLAASAAAALEDGAEVLAETAPLGRFRRRSLAVAVTGAVVVTGWGVIVAVAVALSGPTSPGEPGLPVGGLVVELVVLCAVGWAITALAIGWSGWRGSGARAGAGMLVFVALTAMTPDVSDWFWTASNTDPGAWSDTHLRWAGLGVLAATVLVATSRDAAAPSPRRLLPT